jgi:hypothetical protein
MTDIIFRAVALAFDGFIVCLGLGALVPFRKRLSISTAFGAFDSVAYASGALLGAAFPWVFALGSLKPMCGLALASYGAFVILLVARGQTSILGRAGWLVLPALLSLDNLMAGACMPIESLPAMVMVTAITSGAMAYLGLQLGFRLMQNSRFPHSRVIRGIMVLIASLLLFAH